MTAWTINSARERNWKVEMSTLEQRRLFNAACGDLADQLRWHGFRLSKDDWRHLLSGTVLGWRMMPAIDKGEGKAAGFIMLGGSSLDLSKKQCTEAIELAFLIGDHPEGQGIDAQPVRWCAVVCGARWLADDTVEYMKRSNAEITGSPKASPGWLTGYAYLMKG